MRHTITFREPFPVKELIDDTLQYRILVSVNTSSHVKMMMIENKQHQEVMDELVRTDKKLLGAVVEYDGDKFVILKHSPQQDFFKEVQE